MAVRLERRGRGEMDETFKRRKKMVYDFICGDFYAPMKLKELAVLLQIPREQRGELKEVLDALVGDGKISVSRRGKYRKGAPDRETGIYKAHLRGFGFVSVEGQEDIFIGEEDVNGALQGDTVEVSVTRAPDGRRREGKVIRIISRGTIKLVGLYQAAKNGNYGFVIPDDRRFGQDIFIPEEFSRGVVNGHKVVAELTSYGGGGKKPEGKITEIIGHVGDPGTDILSIVKGFDLPLEFSKNAMNQAMRTADEVVKADMDGRRDLRDWQMVTIDGEDAKDLDDAVSITKDGENYILGVHIADVANYVQEGSALDKEAQNRGTSVYLADRVIPMLPHKLSNGICSLNAGVDRLALSCIMTVNGKGAVVDHEIVETVIRVDERMTYTSVKKILTDHDARERKRYQRFVPMFERMEELALILQEKRRQRGAIHFDFPEAKIVLDENGTPLEIKPYERNAATRIIEDFMLLANETVAEEFYWREIPFLYRTHEPPDEEKVKKLAVFINNFGYSMHIGANKLRPKEVQKLLTKVEGSPEENLISRLALRSMKQARYAPENTGHFGLAAPCYTHFTSPIRRYPDLQIHRIIKDSLRGRLNEQKEEHYRKILGEVAKHSSETERRAEEAERETVKLKKAEYMSRHIGEIYEGIISGITKWGVYVELSNTVEGLVHVTNMRGDHYVYNEERYEMTGEQTRRTYKLGQSVKIKVAGADKAMRTIDFELEE